MSSGTLIEAAPRIVSTVSRDWVVEPSKLRLAARWPKLSDIEFYVSKEQQRDGGTIDGKKLIHDLRDREHLDGGYMDHLLANPHRIPVTWMVEYYGRPLHIFFAGVQYRNTKMGQLFVRCIRHVDGCWSEGYAALCSEWHCNNAVALVKPRLSMAA